MTVEAQALFAIAKAIEQLATAIAQRPTETAPREYDPVGGLDDPQLSRNQKSKPEPAGKPPAPAAETAPAAPPAPASKTPSDEEVRAALVKAARACGGATAPVAKMKEQFKIAVVTECPAEQRLALIALFDSIADNPPPPDEIPF